MTTENPPIDPIAANYRKFTKRQALERDLAGRLTAHGVDPETSRTAATEFVDGCIEPYPGTETVTVALIAETLPMSALGRDTLWNARFGRNGQRIAHCLVADHMERGRA